MQQQVPKVKIGEKITALQQIVSPFGKVLAYMFNKLLCTGRARNKSAKNVQLLNHFL
jgi:hypothetical protein